jgi:hypothetical protein
LDQKCSPVGVAWLVKGQMILADKVSSRAIATEAGGSV